VEVFASRALEGRCRRVDEVFVSRAPELWRACYRCRDVKEFASRRLEMRRRRVASLPQELWRHAAGRGTWRCDAGV